MRRVVFTLFGSLWLTGCGISGQQPKATAINGAHITAETTQGRFAVFQGTPKLALDTKTGLACKTWNWTDSTSSSSIPLCIDLYRDEDATVKTAATNFDWSKFPLHRDCDGTQSQQQSKGGEAPASNQNATSPSLGSTAGIDASGRTAFPGAPPIGTVEEGDYGKKYKYIGGDPGEEKNWSVVKQ